MIALRLKHPPPPLHLGPPPTEPVSQTSSVSEEEVMVALKSFRSSSVGGVDGLRPENLKDLFAPQTAEAGRRLLNALANLCSKLLRGKIPKHARDPLFAANLTALQKKAGNIRPIAVRPWSTMECSQPAAWTTNRSLLVASRVRPFQEDRPIPARTYPELRTWMVV